MTQPTLSELFEVLHENISLSSSDEIKKACELIIEVQALDSGECDCIVASCENGPLDDGDVPSKTSRNNLLTKGFMVKVVVKGEDGYNACTQKGYWAYKLLKLNNTTI
jgi:hypothetical protein